MSDEKVLKREAVYLLRSLIKMSSALNDLDVIMESKKYIKFKLKKDVCNWLNMIDNNTSELMRSLVNEDDETLSGLYHEFEKIDNSIAVNLDRDKRHLIIFYTKLFSALNDVDKIESNRYTVYPIMINFFTKKVIESILKQNPFIKELKKDYDSSIEDLILFMDKQGEEVMFYNDDV